MESVTPVFPVSPDSGQREFETFPQSSKPRRHVSQSRAQKDKSGTQKQRAQQWDLQRGQRNLESAKSSASSEENEPKAISASKKFDISVKPRIRSSLYILSICADSLRHVKVVSVIRD